MGALVPQIAASRSSPSRRRSRSRRSSPAAAAKVERRPGRTTRRSPSSARSARNRSARRAAPRGRAQAPEGRAAAHSPRPRSSRRNRPSRRSARRCRSRGAATQRQKQLERDGCARRRRRPQFHRHGAKSVGPSASYAGRIKARIRPTSSSLRTAGGNPQATVEVKTSRPTAPSSAAPVKRSGVPAWDEAVLRAIDKTEVLPRDTDGRVPPSLEISFRPATEPDSGEHITSLRDELPVPEQAAHDLAGAGLGQVVAEADVLGLAIGPISLPTQSRSSFGDALGFVAGGARALQHDEGADRLAGGVVGRPTTAASATSSGATPAPTRSPSCPCGGRRRSARRRCGR